MNSRSREKVVKVQRASKNPIPQKGKNLQKSSSLMKTKSLRNSIDGDDLHKLLMNENDESQFYNTDTKDINRLIIKPEDQLKLSDE
ncbi:MAG: hypothetical protein MHPSP_003640, partial [Paramarteilia canceri]